MTALVDTKRVLARNTAWNYAGFAINLVTNLIMFPFVVHHIGDAAAGVWLLLSSVTGYMGLLELGIVPSLTQAIAASLARDHRDAVSRAASSAMAVLLGLAGLSLLLFPFAPRVVGALGIPGALQHEALLALRVTVIGFALRMPLATFQGVLLGYQRQDRCNQLWIVLGLAKFAGAVLVLGSGYGLLGLVSAEMLLHLMAGALQIRWAFQEDADLRLSVRFVHREDAVRLLSFGSAILAVTICSLIIEQTDRVVIAAFLPIAMVTYYASAWKIYMLAFALTTTFVQAVSPIAANLYGRGDFDGLKQMFVRSTKYTLAIAWPLVMTLGFSAGFLLRWWIGAPFVGALPTVQVLLIGFLVTAHNHAGYSALIGIRRVGPTVMRYFAPQAVLNLGLSIWLVQRYGNVGVAIGTIAPAILLEYFFLDFALAELKVGWKEFLRRAAGPVALAGIVSYLPLAIVYGFTSVTSPVLPLTAAACTVLYAALLWRCLDEEERQEIMGYVPAFLSRHVGAMGVNRAFAPRRSQV